MATLSERLPAVMGTFTRASAAACTDSGTPDDSRPTISVSSFRNEKPSYRMSAAVVSSTRRPASPAWRSRKASHERWRFNATRERQSIPARRSWASPSRNPQGSMMSTGTPRHAAVRSMVPAFCGISGSNRASRMGAGRRYETSVRVWYWIVFIGFLELERDFQTAVARDDRGRLVAIADFGIAVPSSLRFVAD